MISPTQSYRNVDGDDSSLHHEDPLSSTWVRGYRDPRQRQWSVLLFSICTVLLFADQNLMAPNLSAIADFFGFDDLERDAKLGGDISLAFFVLGAPASFLIGCLADVSNRSRLFGITVGIGEGACLATYWVQTYPQLYVCRAVTGFSLGGALPLIYSVLGDLFSADERHSVSAIVGIGTGLGTALGQGISGYLGPTFGWRLPFLIISLPALIVALMVTLTVQDPKRGCMEEAVLRDRALARFDSKRSVEMTPLDSKGKVEAHVSPETNTLESSELSFDFQSQLRTLRELLSTPTVLLMLVQGAPGCVPWGIVGTYLNDFLSENRGMTVEWATTVILIFGLGNFVGLSIGGLGGSWLYRADKRYPSILAGVCAILSCPPLWALLNLVNDNTSFFVVVLVSGVAGVFSGVTGPIVKATVQNVSLPNARGQCFALLNTFDDFGRGLGPVFVAMLIKRMGGRTPAFNVGVAGWLFCGIFNLCVFFTVARDENSVQARLTDAMKERQTRQESDQLPMIT